jgi:outer membrane protein assembly factor BamB
MPDSAAAKSVFICHAKEDLGFARDIFAALKKAGIPVWMDRPPDAFALEGLLPGQDVALRIEQQLGASDALLVMLSPRSIAQQGYAEPEFRLALHAVARRRLPIIAVLQEACDVPNFAAGGINLRVLPWSVIAPEEIGKHIEGGGVSPALAHAPPTKETGGIRHPVIRWRAFVGRIHWRNNIQIDGDRLYVTSCGARWNEDDRGDGVYCLDAATGAQRWTFNSAGDANEALIHGDGIALGTDAGQFALLDKASGALRLEHRVWHPIFARPFALGQDAERIFAISHKGVVMIADTGAGKISEVATLPFPVRANPALNSDAASAVVFGETGEIARAWREGDAFKWERLATKSYRPPGAPARRHAGLIVPPLIDGTSVIGGAIRDTYYKVTPLFRFDTAQKKFLWGERDEETRGKNNPFGNLRSAPLVMDDEVIFAPAYAAALYAADKSTGEIRWRLPVGAELLQQWSAPVPLDARRVVLARADGVLYQIDVKERTIEWALSLIVTPSEMQAANRSGKFGPGPSEAAHNGITATPLWHNGRIFLGTTEGQLFCIEEASGASKP